MNRSTKHSTSPKGRLAPQSRTAEFTLPEGGVDTLLHTLAGIDSELPVFVYERIDPLTRQPLTTWIGLRTDATRVQGTDTAAALRAATVAARADGPHGGVFAFLGYPGPHSTVHGDAGIPDALLMRLIDYVTIDHRTGRGRVVHTSTEPDPERTPEQWASACGSGTATSLDLTSHEADFQWTTQTSAEQYTAGVRAFQQRGGASGVVLSVRVASEHRAEPMHSYRVLRTVNPSTRMFFLRHDQFALWGATSLPLLHLSDGHITAETDGATHPVADEEHHWQPSPKELGEYEVVADALVEDLAHVAAPGTLQLTREREQRVFFGLGHLFAEAQAELAPECDAVDAVLAMHPHGATVGHPRSAAQTLIAELEQVPRGPFAGLVGLFTAEEVDATAVTRSMWTTPRGSVTQAGAKVVPASVAEHEYAESVLKTRALRVTARRASS
ncbi:chorismate-binding protein [Nocardia brasiliensis]|uniref:chorismate-binding protein n=1 Tax=Nocardia brasiliensis TaxID=37326 RepID=UPI00114CB8E6|nr:chorismate-binding protein [Nocardia brasiliensis]